VDQLDATADLEFRGRAIMGGEVVRARVGVRDGTIVWVEPDAAADDGDSRPSAVTGVRGETRLVDLGDDEVLLPGLVDTHVHVNEPGRTAWEGFASATRAAAAGGVTTIIDMPLNSIPPTITLEALAAKRQATQGQRFVDVGFWGGAVPSSVGQLRALYEEGIFGFKCFLLDSGVAEFAPLDSAGLDAAMREVASFDDGLLLVHAEDASTIDGAPPPSGRAYLDFVRSRPPQAEDRAIAEVLEGAAAHGTRVHILHLSNAASLPRLAQARADGIRVTVETCPHYLTLAAEDVPAGQTQYKCCPPIRDGANQDLLWQGLADGVIDIVVSDHSPSTPELKHLDSGDFAQAWGGISSLQLGLPLIWSAASRRGFGLPDVVGWMAGGPARIAGVRGKGQIAEGLAADLVVFAPDESFTVDAERLHHRHPVTPYAGRELTGVVRQTWLRGQQVASRDTVFDVPTGLLLTREGATRA
jgi:allantoinase